MGEYEPDDSRDVTQSSHQAPGEPPRTGFREDGARLRAQATEGTAPQAAAAAQDEGREAGGERAIEGDAPEHPDRMGAFTGETARGEQQQPSQGRQQGQSQQGQSQQGDRWAEAAERDDRLPDGE